MHPSVERKLTPVIEEDDPVIIPVGLSNTIHLFESSLAMTVISFILLIMESIKSNYDKKKEAKKYERNMRMKRKSRWDVNGTYSMSVYRSKQRILNAYYASKHQPLEWQSGDVTRIYLDSKRNMHRT